MRRLSTHAQALVEFTLFIVLLFLFMAGTVDVARAVTVYTYINNAAQEGAIYGAMYPTDVPGIEQRVRETAKSLFRDPTTDLTVQVRYNTQPCPGNLIQVDVTAQMTLIFPFAETFAPARRLTLQTTAHQVILTSNAPTCP